MKREKKFRLAILFLSLFIISYLFVVVDFGTSSTYSEMLITENDFREIISNREELDEHSNPELTFNDFPVYFDSISQSYMYSIVDDHSVGYNPVIHTRTDSFSGYDVAIVNDILNEESIAFNQQAKLVFYTNDYYKTYSLHATTLPIISINMQEQTEDRDNPIGLLDSRAQFELFDNRADVNPSERVVNSQTYIRLRGASSLNFSKNQFRLKLREFSIGGSESNNNLSLLDLREDDDWILSSPYNDPEKMRNTLSYNLWHDTMGENHPFDINTGTEGRFVEVFIDGKYWGIYSLLYPIDAKGLDLTRNNSPQSDFYYRTFSHREFDKEDFTSFEQTYTRGRFELRDPEPNGHPFQWEPLVDHMTHMDSSPEEMHAYFEEQAYLPNLIDYYLFYILLQATDNDTKNRNYIAKYVDGEHFMIESPWDLDLTWGLRWNAEHPRLSEVTRGPLENGQPKQSHVTRAIANGDEEVINQVRNRYDELRQSDWSETSLMNRIDQFEAQLYKSGAAQRDHNRWPTAAYNPDTSELREHILTRLVSMDSYLMEILGGE